MRFHALLLWLHLPFLAISQNVQPDPSFSATNPSNTVSSVALQPDGKILLAGYFQNYNGSTNGRLVRLNSGGSHDTGFNTGDAGPNGQVEAMLLLSDGKIFVGGSFATYNGTSRKAIAKVNTNGTLDTAFDPGTGTTGTVHAIAIQSDGKVLLGGTFGTFNGTNVSNIVRLNTDGTVDNTFVTNAGSGASSGVHGISLQSDGKIILVGQFSQFNGTSVGRICRLNSSGTLDATFNSGGAGASTTIYFCLVESNDKIMIGGNFSSYNGVSSAKHIARLTSGGALNVSFTPVSGANNDVLCVIPQTDGKYLVCGQFGDYDDTDRNRFARLLANGTLDTSLDPGDGFDGRANFMAQASNGEIVVGGSFSKFNNSTVGRVSRLTGSALLPVSLLAFQAKLVGENAVTLHWATASEQNSAHFDVQRSADGRQFETMGQVGAAGNHSVERRYFFEDDAPAPGVNFYRLEQVDLDAEVYLFKGRFY